MLSNCQGSCFWVSLQSSSVPSSLWIKNCKSLDIQIVNTYFIVSIIGSKLFCCSKKQLRPSWANWRVTLARVYARPCLLFHPIIWDEQGNCSGLQLFAWLCERLWVQHGNFAGLLNLILLLNFFIWIALLGWVQHG